MFDILIMLTGTLALFKISHISVLIMKSKVFLMSLLYKLLL